ncbi:MAG: SpoIID/LytB domain-containing protein [Cyanobacteriota bacterium]|nr:SpoIID/LytB domain-containing protein [Cyanobacteriota bacterium]
MARPALRAALRAVLGGAGASLLLVALTPLLGGAWSDTASDTTSAVDTIVSSPLASGPPVRVLLLEGPLITVGAAGPSGLRLRDQEDRHLLEVAPGRQLRVRRSGASLVLELVAAGGPVRIGADAEPPVSRLIPLQELRVEPLDGRSLLVLKQRRYRGLLLLRPQGEGVQAINRLPLESYLLGVIGSEMPQSWPLAALRAQAIASRTYALQQLRPAAPYDLKATVASQVYKGVESESPSVREAVASTQDQVLMHGDRLINAVFHSSSGGQTENSGDLWSRQLPYLVSVPDDDGISPVSRWEQTITPEGLRRAFGEIGGATTIQPLETSKTGRIRRAKVIGPTGELVLTGSALRERLGLRSTLVRFRFEPAGRATAAAGLPPGLVPPPPLAPESSLDAPSTVASNPSKAASPPAVATASGAPTLLPTTPTMRLVAEGRGYGHGVGMSQWGAYALALQGKSHEDILRHYYRGAVLRTW